MANNEGDWTHMTTFGKSEIDCEYLSSAVRRVKTHVRHMWRNINRRAKEIIVSLIASRMLSKSTTVVGVLYCTQGDGSYLILGVKKIYRFQQLLPYSYLYMYF
jgi:hypothetical protein